MVLDLLPPLMQAYFAGKIPCTLSHGQAAIFLCLALQQIDLMAVEKSLNLPSNQILALFNKVGLSLQPAAPKNLAAHLKACVIWFVQKRLHICDFIKVSALKHVMSSYSYRSSSHSRNEQQSAQISQTELIRPSFLIRVFGKCTSSCSTPEKLQLTEACHSRRPKRCNRMPLALMQT